MGILACGNCVWSALYLRFPAIATFCTVTSLWLVALSILRIVLKRSISGVPSIVIVVPALILCALASPMLIGPVLFAWVPVCCAVGTVSLLRNADPVGRRAAMRLAVVACCVGGAFGAAEYEKFGRLTQEQKDKINPAIQMRRLLNREAEKS
jgi:hypothetical protein